LFRNSDKAVLYIIIGWSFQGVNEHLTITTTTTITTIIIIIIQ
jgi:hypothetical protein